MVQYNGAVVYNPTCDETCPENCRQPWHMFYYRNFSSIGARNWNTSDLDRFDLPKPQPISKKWKIDESFKITGGIYQLSIKNY